MSIVDKLYDKSHMNRDECIAAIQELGVTVGLNDGYVELETVFINDEFLPQILKILEIQEKLENS